MVRINQMDATLADASADWARHWILTVLYFAMAVAARKLFVRKGPADAHAA